MDGKWWWTYVLGEGVGQLSCMFYQLMTQLARLSVEVACEHGEVSSSWRQVYELSSIKCLHHAVSQVLVIISAVLSVELQHYISFHVSLNICNQQNFTQSVVVLSLAEHITNYQTSVQIASQSVILSNQSRVIFSLLRLMNFKTKM